MEFTLLEGVMGVGSGLFPLVGKLEKLKGFYPARRRDWYVVISTIFSLLIYAFIQFFEKLQGLPFFIRPLTSGLWAFVFLIIYLAVHLSLKDKYRLNQLPTAGKTAYIIAALVLYVLFVASITYSFNALENYKDYKVIEGTITLYDKKIEKTATIELSYLDDVEDKETHNSKKKGKFFIIIKKEKFDKINEVKVTYFDKDGKKYHSIRGIKQLPINQEWNIVLRETLGD